MEHPETQKSMHALENAVEFGKWEKATENRIKFCGRYYKQDANFTVTVDMIDYVESMTLYASTEIALDQMNHS